MSPFAHVQPQSQHSRSVGSQHSRSLQHESGGQQVSVPHGIVVVVLDDVVVVVVTVLLVVVVVASHWSGGAQCFQGMAWSASQHISPAGNNGLQHWSHWPQHVQPAGQVKYSPSSSQHSKMSGSMHSPSQHILGGQHSEPPQGGHSVVVVVELVVVTVVLVVTVVVVVTVEVVVVVVGHDVSQYGNGLSASAGQHCSPS